MENIKKKGTNMKKIVTVLWFVFCVLSSLFFVCNKSYAEKVTYKYTFNIGPSDQIINNNKLKATIGEIKLVYTVEEETTLSVNNSNRYKIINKEVYGWDDIRYRTDYLKSISTEKGINLSNASNINMYNFFCYSAMATGSSTSRKLMKAFLIAYITEGNDYEVKKLYVSENGWRQYFFLDKTATNDVVRDEHFSDYVWLYDKKKINRDFHKMFMEQIEGTYEYSVYDPEYCSERIRYLVGTDHADVRGELSNDTLMLININRCIENDTDAGKVLKGCKVRYHKDDPNSIYTWRVKNNSYNKSENSIIIEVLKNRDTHQFDSVFEFKYAPEKKYATQMIYPLDKTTLSGFEYLIDLSTIDQTKNKLQVAKPMNNNLNDFIHMNDKNKVVFNYGSKTDFYQAIYREGSVIGGPSYIYIGRFKKDDNDTKEKGYGITCLTIPEDDLLESLVKAGGKKDSGDILYLRNNGYVFEFDKTGTIVKFYKEDTPDDVMTINLKSLYSLNIDTKDSYTDVYGLSPRADQLGGTDYRLISNQDKNGDTQYKWPTLTAKGKVINDGGEEYNKAWQLNERIDAMFYTCIKDPSKNIYLSVYDLTGINESLRGVADNAIPLKNATLLAEVPIMDWMKIVYKDKWKEFEKKIEDEEGPGYIIVSPEEIEKNLYSFYHVLYRYGKPIVMFLILIAIIIACIYAIMDHSDPEKRVLLKLRIKNILLGAFFFAVSFLIITIGTHYFTVATNNIVGSDEIYSYDISLTYDNDQNWLVNIVEDIINAVAKTLEWVRDYVASRMLLLEDRKLDLSDVIFISDSTSNLSLYPYKPVEWKIYMFGYRLLTSLAICLIGFALIKSVVMIIFSAGNREKELQVRQDALRMVAAILAIVIVPYGFRLMLLFVNSLVQLVPITASKFTLDFEGFKILGAIANLMYVITELKIFIAFVVRKVMMTFLLISTPVIFGTWAISEKFRSFNLWFGELLTNIFVQLSYALTFYFIYVILSEETNPFAVLLMIMLSIKLADFIKDSLQGLFNQWGGIDETGVATEALNKAKDIGGTIAHTPKIVANKTGRFISNASKFIDKDQTSNAGFVATNIGNALQGKHIVTKKERMQRVANALSKEESKHKSFASADKKMLDKRRQIATSNRNKGDRENEDYERMKNAYDILSDYQSGNLSYNEAQEKLHELQGKDDRRIKEYENATEQMGDYELMAHYISEFDTATAYGRGAYNTRQEADNVTGILSSLQGSVSDKKIEQFMGEHMPETKEEFDKLATEYEEKIEKAKEEASALNKGSLSSEDQEFKKEHLKNVLEEILSNTETLGRVGTDLNLDLKELNLENNYRETLRSLSDNCGVYRFDKFNNLDTIKAEVMRSTENKFNQAEEELEEYEKNLKKDKAQDDSNKK